MPERKRTPIQLSHLGHFLIDPKGVEIELNFAAEEARDIEADVMASQLSA